MLPRFEKLYAKKYPPEAYRKEVQGDGARAAGALRAHGDARDGATRTRTTGRSCTEPEQVGFAW